MHRDVATWVKKQHGEQDELHYNQALGYLGVVERFFPGHKLLEEYKADRNYTIDCHLFWLLACKLETLSRTPAAGTIGAV